MFYFGPPKTIISDTRDTSPLFPLLAFREKQRVTLSTVLAYAPMSNMSNVRAQRMVRNIKNAAKKMVLVQGMDWEESLLNVTYKYRRRRLASGASTFELMYGVMSCMESSDALAFIYNESESRRRLELLGKIASLARRRNDQ